MTICRSLNSNSEMGIALVPDKHHFVMDGRHRKRGGRAWYMGEMIHLKIGGLEIGSGKNAGFADYSPFFQQSDVAVIPYDYVSVADGTPLTEHQEGYSRRLADVAPRLDLLGLTHRLARDRYDSLVREANSYDWLVQDANGSLRLSFRKFCKALCAANISDLPTGYPDRLPENLLPSRIAELLSISDNPRFDILPYLSHVVRRLDPWCLLRILALNPLNGDKPVKWEFADVVKGGWVKREEVVRELSPQERFLLITEGSSDSKILRKAFDLLRPQVADFFNFIDMKENYPFVDTGSLHNFCQGLVKIGILNRIVVIYDNDAEENATLTETRRLQLPTNIRVIKLPDLSQFRQFPTIGPYGSSLQDINGGAAAVECYLDLNWDADVRPRVRWTNDNAASGQYQGVLEGKDSYKKSFLDLRRREPSYDFRKIERILDAVIRECVAMAEEVPIRKD